MKLIRIACILSLALLAASCTNMHHRQARNTKPPEPAREFRGAWVATVANIDWPSKPGLSASQQKAEAIQILDKMVALHMNVAVLQVRTACDALYKSNLEPWSVVFTGQEGKSPGYDPLKFWITQAHRRGIQLHAWINPFRSKAYQPKYTNAPNHLSNTHPDWVVSYTDGRQTAHWLDPGNPAAMNHVYNVVMDIVRRYDIDGIHLDDYFYPYPLRDKHGDIISFPDGPSYARYWASGGRLRIDDWRRQNINDFIHRLYKGIHAEKKWVQLGIAPFGIWKPGHPRGIEGFNAYTEIDCDSRLWLRKGWVDYFAPQLYWKISAPQQNFLLLVDWWMHQNPHHRTLCPGLFTSRLNNRGFSRDEIGDQIGVIRTLGADGEIHFSVKALMKDYGNIDDLLIGKTGIYEDQALIPPSPWLDNSRPARPIAQGHRNPSNDSVTVSWKSASNTPVWQWAVQTRSGNTWTLHVYPTSVNRATFEKKPKTLPISAVAVRAVDRCGLISKPAVIESAQ